MTSPAVPHPPSSVGCVRGAAKSRRKVWLHTGTEAGSVRGRPLSARKDSVTIRLPSARFGVSDPGHNPCLSVGRCTWILPWVRALRIKPHPPRSKPKNKMNGTSTDSGWLWLPKGPPYVHVR
ncbi:hypothetical protein HPB50_004001 [Hyalomma asiaticum]|uniref:Uncharacterized protein n=1 Tax=Hyalomma asiaticum TaxID=266040 RepID=A0ACB7T3D3_HYAAI|nr:hypothetical protein HPB50_004001 [Hyalomma asiaticum]